MDQHKTPALSLKHFAGPDGYVWTYDKVRQRCWPARPERTSVEAHYYSVEREDGTMDVALENSFSRIEGESSPIYQNIVNGVIPHGSDCEIFGHFLGLMYVRSPAVRRISAEVYKSFLETNNAFTAQNPEAFASFIKRLEAQGIDISDKEFIRSSISDMSHSDLMIPKTSVLRIVAQYDKVANIFLQMNWMLARAKHHFFVTSDSPICRGVDPKTCHPILGDHGLLNKTAVVSFPVSKNRLLVMSWRDMPLWEIEIRRDSVKKENNNRVFHAVNEVYAHIEHRVVRDMVFRSKPANYKAVFSLPKSKGFRRVVVPRRWPKPTE
jgi:hypothetical protein